MNKNKLYYKTNMTYDDWLKKYKGKSVYDISYQNTQNGLDNLRPGTKAMWKKYEE